MCAMTQISLSTSGLTRWISSMNKMMAHFLIWIYCHRLVDLLLFFFCPQSFIQYMTFILKTIFGFVNKSGDWLYFFFNIFVSLNPCQLQSWYWKFFQGVSFCGDEWKWADVENSWKEKFLWMGKNLRKISFYWFWGFWLLSFGH